MKKENNSKNTISGFIRLLIMSFFLITGLWTNSNAQALLTSASPTYSQNFNALSSTVGTTTWTDNSTVPSWYAINAGGAISTLNIGTGSSATGGLWDFGVAGTNPVTDRALGAISNTAPNTPMVFGVRLKNNDPTLNITSLVITYTGETWRRNAGTQAMNFAYEVGATGLNTPASYISFNSLDYSPVTGAAAALDGNATANRTVFSAVSLTVTVAAGQEVWLRWSKANATNSPGPSVDDFSVTAVYSVPIANDICSDALLVTPGASCVNTNGTTADANDELGLSTICGTSTTGAKDKWCKFNANGSSNYSINLAATSGVRWQMNLYSSCGGSIINCADGGGTNTAVSMVTGVLAAGTYYYSIQGRNGNTGAFSTCVTIPPNPCSGITNIASCGVATTNVFASQGGWYNPPSITCGFSTPGVEKIYTFTPPVTGNYQIDQPTSFDYIDYFYKAASGGCSGTGWTCIDDISNANLGNANVAIALTGGTQYYFLLDPESTTGGSVTFSILSSTPTAPTSAGTSANNYCSNTGGTLNLTATGGSGGTLTWYTGSCGGTSIGTGTPLTISKPTSTTTYYAGIVSACGNVSTCASVTVTVNPIPVTTGNTVCSGENGTISATATCSNGGSFTATGTNANSFTLNNSSPLYNITLPVSGVPAGAIITDVDVSVTVTHTYQGDVVLGLKAADGVTTVSLTGASGTGLGNDLSGTYTFDQSASTTAWGINNPATPGSYKPDAGSGAGSLDGFNGLTFINGNWVLTADDDANMDNGAITSVTVTIKYSAPGTIEWYDQPTLGNMVGTGSPFDPVPTASGTYTYYATCSTSNTCRAAANFVIHPLQSGNINSPDLSICEGEDAHITGTVTATGPWTLYLTDDGNAPSISGSGTQGFDIVVNPTTPGPNMYEIIQIDLDASPFCSVDYVNNPTNLTGSTIVTVEVPPTASGLDKRICATGGTLDGSFGGSATGVTWSGGAGTYGNVNDINSSYIPTSTEISNGSVIMTLTSTGSVACGAAVDNNVVIDIDAAVPPQPAPISGAPAAMCTFPQTLTLNIPTVTEAQSYTWYAGPGSLGMTFNGATNSISQSITFNSTPNSTFNVRVDAINTCGNSAYRSVSIRTKVSGVATLTGPAQACPNDINKIYTASAVTGATDYTWTGPSGILFDGNASPYTANDLSVNATYPGVFTGGTICITANLLTCYSSPPQCLTITAAPEKPSGITGTFQLCPGTQNVDYTVTNVPGLIYTWTAPANSVIDPTGPGGANGTNTIRIDYNANFVSGDIQVYATGPCGVSPVRSKTVSRGSGGQTVASPNNVSGAINALCGATNVTYTALPLNASATYNWVFPAGTTVNSQTANTINVDFAPTIPSTPAQTISVTAQIGCVTSSPRIITIKGAPGKATVSGPATVCSNSTGNVFSVPAYAGPVTYTWYVPTGASITNGAGTNSITVTWGPDETDGTVSLFASNACGNATSSKAVDDNCRLSPASADAASLMLFNAYPNPASTAVNVEFKVEKGQQYVVRMLDLSGRILFTARNVSDGQTTLERFDVSTLAKGIYILSVETGNDVVRARIAVE